MKEVSLDNYSLLPYIIAIKGKITSIGQSFLGLTEYSKDEIINRSIDEIGKLLRIDMDIRIESEGFIFTKHLEPREVTVKVLRPKDIDVKIYVFNEKPCSRLDITLGIAQKLFEDSSIGVGIYSAPDFTLLKANQLYLDLMDEPYNIRENVIGLNVAQVLPFWEGSRAQEKFLEVINHNKVFYGKEILGITECWKYKYCDSTTIPVNYQGKIKYIVSVIEDITDKVITRKKMDEQAAIIRMQNEKLKAIIDNMSDAIVTTDMDYIITSWNRSAGIIYGWSEEEALGKHIGKLLKTEFVDYNHSNSYKILMDFGQVEVELKQKNKSGETLYVLAKTSLIKDRDGNVTGIVGVMCDITVKKIMENMSRSMDRIRKLIHSTLNFSELMNKIISEATTALDCESAAISLRQNNKWIVSYVYGFSSEMIGLEMNDEEEPHAMLAVKTKKPVFINDAENDERVNKEQMKKWGIRSVVALPLLTDDKVFGVVFFNHYTGIPEFRKWYVEFVQNLATSISLALKNVSLYEEVCKELAERKRLEAEIKRKKEEIKKRKEELEIIVESISDGVFVIDKNNKPLVLNHAARAVMIKSDEDKDITNNPYSICYYDMNGRALSKEELPFTRIVKGEEIRNELVYTKRSDRTYCYEISGSPIRDKAGNVSMAIFSSKDVTERIRNEKEIIEQKIKLEAILENISEALIIFEESGKITKLNKSAREQVAPIFKDLFTIGDGRKQKEYYDSWGNLIAYENIPTLRVRRGEVITEYRMTVKNDEELIHIDLNGTPVYDEKGNFIAGILSCRNVSEQVKKDEIIRSQKEQLEAVVKSMSDGLKIVDDKLRISFLNQAARNFFHKPETNIYAGDSLVYNKYYYGIDGKEIPCQDLPTFRVFNKGSFQNYILTIENRERRIHASVNGSPIYNDSGEVKSAILCYRDITEQVKQEESIKAHQTAILKAEHEKNKVLENAMKMKDEFLTTITHEFKTPLTVINAALQTIESLYGGQLNKNVKKHMERIRVNSFRQLRLVNNLLDITRYNAGHLKIQKENLDIVFLTYSITKSVEGYAKQKCVELIFSSEVKYKQMAIDEEKYERIILNLLSNAIKFTPKGKSIHVNIEYKNRKAFIRVKDEGIGIPKNKQAEIFERFGQVDSSLSRQAEGTGIGLSLVKALVTGLGGKISVESEVGKGSTFHIELPANKIRSKPDKYNIIESQDNRIMQAVEIEFSDIYLT